MIYEPNESYLDRITRIKTGATTGTYDPNQAFYGSSTPVASTQPVASTPSYTSPSYAPGGLQIEGGGMQQLPTIMKDWISWQDATPEQWTSSGGDGGSTWMSQVGRDAGYGFNQNAGTFIDSPFYRNTDNYEWSFDPKTGAPTLRTKTADKTGTYVNYVQDAAGNWVPDYSTANAQGWETNNNDDFYRGVGGVLAAAVGGNLAAGAGALGNAAQGAWTAGLTAEQAALAASLGLGSGAAGTGATATAGVQPMSEGVLSGVYGTAGSPLGAGLTGGTGAAGSAMTAAELAGGAGSTASTLSQITDYAKKGMSFVEAVQKVMGGSGQQPGQAGSPSIIDMLGAYYSAQQMKDFSGNQKEMYSTQRGVQKPYLDQLLASYQDPNSFYSSNQWKGLESVYQNSIDRGAAKTGRLANPTDREVLLNNYAMKELENYRSGLRNAVQATDPSKYAEIYGKGLETEAFANTAPWATASRGGTGNTVQQIQSVWNTVKDVGSTAEDIWKFIEGWFD